MSRQRLEVARAWFESQPSSVPAARLLLRTTVDEAFGHVDVSVATLLVSELVTNAVVHAGTPVEMVLCALGDADLEVQVSDGSSRHPRPRRRATAAGLGQGLRLVDELSDSWGVQLTPTGKTVWFRLRGSTPTPGGDRLGP